MTCVDPSSVWSCGLDVPFRCQRSDARSLTTGDSSGAGVSTRVQMTPFGLEFSPRSCDRALKALSDPVCHQTSQTTCVWPQGRVGVWAPVLRGFIDPRGPRVCAPRVWAPLSVLTSALSPCVLGGKRPCVSGATTNVVLFHFSFFHCNLKIFFFL